MSMTPAITPRLLIEKEGELSCRAVPLSSPDLAGLAERVAAASPADLDRGLDDELSRLDPAFRAMRIHPYLDGWLIDDAKLGRDHATPAYTASLDAALALVERCGFRPEDMLPEAIESMLTGGYHPNRPMVPQIALAVLGALLVALEQPA